MDIKNEEQKRNVTLEGRITVKEGKRPVKWTVSEGVAVGTLSTGLLSGVYHLEVETGEVKQQVMLVVTREVTIQAVSQKIVTTDSPRHLEAAENIVYVATQNSQIHV